MCGILAYYHKNINNYIIRDFLISLSKLEHRGQDGFGIFYNNNIIIEKTKMENIISENIENKFNYSENTKCILGHTRYITSGKKNNSVYQPITNKCKFGNFTIIYNGNIPINKYNYLFKNKNIEVDTNMIIDFIIEESYKKNSFNDVLINFINIFDRAFSIIINLNDELYVLRDKYNVKPLIYYKDNDNIVFSSESCIFNDEKKNLNEVKNGEILHISNFEIKTIYNSNIKYNSRCIFEYIYFMDEKSKWDSLYVYDFRKKLGNILASSELDQNILNNKNNYLVVGIPNTGKLSAKEYSKDLKLEYNQCIVKNENIQRTFILKNNIERENAAKNKYVYDTNMIKNRNLVIIDDSLVRGITMKQIIKDLKKNGANEIHIRIACPKIKDRCYYGIDIPTQSELLINKFNDEYTKIINFLNCNSCYFIDVEKLKTNFGNKYCTGCFNSDYKNKNLEW